MTDCIQAWAYEALAHLGPAWSAILAGFAFLDLFGQLCLTPAGARYLQRRRS